MRRRQLPLGEHLRDALVRNAEVSANVDAAESWSPDVGIDGESRTTLTPVIQFAGMLLAIPMTTNARQYGILRPVATAGRQREAERWRRTRLTTTQSEMCSSARASRFYSPPKSSRAPGR